MNRRRFTASAAAASLSASSAQTGAKPAIFELRRIQLRNSTDNQRARTVEFLEKSFVPAAKRAGIETAGFFSSLIAADSPFLVVLLSYPSLAAMEAAYAKLEADRGYRKEREAYTSKPGLGYVRMESSLLRAFPSMPAVERPPAREGGASRVFELRTYESDNGATLARKIGMFEKGETAIFRRTGLLPVFFGETIVGAKMPNLTYMLAFDDLAAREKNWRTFLADPEWQKLRSTPGLSDAEIVSNISSVLLNPLPFSSIR